MNGAEIVKERFRRVRERDRDRQTSRQPGIRTGRDRKTNTREGEGGKERQTGRRQKDADRKKL